MKQCPECGTVQTKLTPFCENCGFRLRNQATAVEGVAAITPEMLQRTVSTNPNSVRQTQEANDTPETKPHQTRPETEAPKTVMGDLAAIPFDQVNTAPSPQPDEEDRSAISSIIMDRPADRSAIFKAPQPSAPPKVGANKLVLLTGIWGGMTMFGVLLTYFLITTQQQKAQPDAIVETPASTLQLQGGKLVQGLDESSRSFILQVCMKISDEPDRECEQKRLLRNEYPQKDIQIEAFSIDSTEVTTGQYQACVEAGACEAIEYKSCKVYTPKGLQISLRVPKTLKLPNHPVVCVSRKQAQTYCEHNKGRLPTNAQWEYAARGEEGVLFPWGETWSPERANWGEFDLVKSAVSGKIDRFAWTAPPGQYPKGKSPMDVHDMAGNVAEWVSGEGRFGEVRGGSWISDPFSLRTTVRKRVLASARRTDVGFRCVYE